MSTTDEGQLVPVVTISASYGAGGSVVAPSLAERLGVAFVDRVITSDVSQEASGLVRSAEGISPDEEAASPGHRLFTYLARAASVGALMAPEILQDDDAALRDRAEAALGPLLPGRDGGTRGTAPAGTGGTGGAPGGNFASGAVVLGRAAAVVLAERPRTLHVRLDGPRARRIRQAAEIEGIAIERATVRLAETDRSRTLWVRRLYGADAASPTWYHLWVDSTVISLDAVVELLERVLAEMLAKG